MQEFHAAAAADDDDIDVTVPLEAEAVRLLDSGTGEGNVSREAITGSNPQVRAAWSICSAVVLALLAQSRLAVVTLNYEVAKVLVCLLILRPLDGGTCQGNTYG